jgi:hypothetical protein
MPGFESINDLVRDHLRRSADAARRLYKHSVRPIYRAVEDGRPECIGSGVLLEFSGMRYLATAAHVIDEEKYGSLFLGGYPEFIPLNAVFTKTVAAGGPDEDHVDVAVSKISQAMASGLGELPFIAQADQVEAPQKTPGSTSLAMGYPHTKNKAPWWGKTHVKPEILTYLSTFVPVPGAAKRFEGGAYNFALALQKFGKRDGVKVKIPTLNGTSGGGVFDLGALPTLDQLAAQKSVRPKLAGLIIERKDKALICTEMSAVYMCIQELH